MFDARSLGDSGEIRFITLAACVLMAANSKLSPEDAVSDALQAYQHALHRMKTSSRG